MLLYLTAASLLAAAEPDAAAARSADAPDIVVTGQRLKRIRVSTNHDRKTGLSRCVVKRSSGDGHLDAAVCNAVLVCAQTARAPNDMEACLAPRLSRIAAQSVHQSDRP
jgi:hypothetical protein